MSQHIKQKVLRKTFLTRHWELMFFTSLTRKNSINFFNCTTFTSCSTFFPAKKPREGAFKILGKKDYTSRYNVHVAST